MQRTPGATPQTGQPRGALLAHIHPHGFPLLALVQSVETGGQRMSGGGRDVGAHVLVVEDEADLRTALVELLSIWGYRVSTARDGREALERLRTGREPLLVLLDLQMPVMDGDELLDEVSRHPPRRPLRIVVLSANLDAPQRASHDHVTAALRKPVLPERLHATLDAEVSALH